MIKWVIAFADEEGLVLMLVTYFQKILSSKCTLEETDHMYIIMLSESCLPC